MLAPLVIQEFERRAGYSRLSRARSARADLECPPNVIALLNYHFAPDIA
jgi:hypothetical protein